MLIGNIYRSPSSSVENYKQLNMPICEAVALKDSHLLIEGDFNYGSINLESMQSEVSIDQCSSYFVEFIKYTFLHQHVERETRFRIDHTPSRLDLIFTYERNTVSDLSILPRLVLAITHV